MNSKDKIHSDLNRLLKEKDIKSEKELHDFMNSLIGKPLPFTLPVNNIEKAEDIMIEAYELLETGRVDMSLVLEALRLDPECVTAYLFMGSIQPDPLLALPFYTYGTEIGRKVLGKEFFKKNKGDFWYMPDTRPFMHCLYNSACCFMSNTKQVKQAITIFEEILELSSDDNLGARNLYMCCLIQEGKWAQFDKIDKRFGYEQSAAAMFNRVLATFIREGQQSAESVLLKALKINKFCLKELLKVKPSPVSESYMQGSKEEAVYYASFARNTWKGFPDAIKWIETFKK